MAYRVLCDVSMQFGRTHMLLSLGAMVPNALAWVWLWRKLLATPAPFASLHDVSTADGARIRIGHMAPEGVPSALPPVVMCHGLGMNCRALAFDRETSLAGELARAGRDVWLIDLRGADNGAFSSEHAESSFDEHARHDVPAAIAWVCEQTGAREVDWVGFSMGGMLAYAHLGALGGRGIRRLVTLGSPMLLHRGRHFRPLGVLGSPRVHVMRRTPIHFASSLVAPLMGRWMPHFMTPGLRAGHYSNARLRRVLTNVMGNTPRGVSRQFLQWLGSDAIGSRDGASQYLPALRNTTVPTRVIAGSQDRVAPRSSVASAFEALGSPEKDFRVVGLETGAHDDYDHLDLILGERASSAVFPLVLDWLMRE